MKTLGLLINVVILVAFGTMLLAEIRRFRFFGLASKNAALERDILASRKRAFGNTGALAAAV
jgi:hypothetical protein